MNIHCFEGAKEITGEREIHWYKPDAKLGELFNDLDAFYSNRFHELTEDFGKSESNLEVLINGRDAEKIGGLNAKIKMGDDIYIVLKSFSKN